LIRKGLDEFQPTDKFAKAGIQAERQMAFYLKLAFAEDPSLLILNGIRLESDGDFAQIDHLIIHKYGMVIVESKSVTGKVVVNDCGEWSRQFLTIRGMPSPIEQAKRQAAFLKKWLDKSGPSLPSHLGIKREYEKLPVDVLVAVSDNAIIQRPKQLELDNVCKAEVIADKITTIIRNHKKESGFFSLSFRPFTLSAEIRNSISECLGQAHISAETKPEPSIKVTHYDSIVANQPPEELRCHWCGSNDCTIKWLRYGHYGYYLRCNKCSKNTLIDRFCPHCHKKMKLHRSKNEFYADCPSCKASMLFRPNPFLSPRPST